MKIFLVIAMGLMTGATAKGSSLYGVPAPHPRPAPPEQQFITESSRSEQKVHKHVYVHVAPEESDSEGKQIIRVPGGGNKHVNIIFVKTPSQSAEQKTEIILPEQQHRNLIYVLIKKGDSNGNIKFRRAQNQGVSKPEVYFIRYKSKEETNNYAPSQKPTVSTAKTTYGVPTYSHRRN